MPPLPFVLQGAPVQAQWQPPVLEQLFDDELPSGPLSDFPYLSGVPVFSARAVNVLLDLLVQNGELLPATFTEGQYHIFNVTTVVDALDEERSALKRFESSGRVMEIHRFSFIPNRVSGLSIFKIPQMVKPLVLVTDRFVERVRTSQLTGFVFETLWTG